MEALIHIWVRQGFLMISVQTSHMCVGQPVHVWAAHTHIAEHMNSNGVMENYFNLQSIENYFNLQSMENYFNLQRFYHKK